MRMEVAVIRGMTAALVLAGAAACSSPPETPPPAPPDVGVTTPERRDVTDFAEFTGTVRATASAEVRARVAGRLDGMYFEPSTHVRKGQRLFVIEPETYQAARDEAFASLKAAEAEKARAESDLSRIEQAIQTQAVSEQDLDLAKAKLQQAEAAVLSAQARLQKAELDLSYTSVVSPISGQVSRNLIDVGNLVGQGEATVLTTVNALDPIFVYFDASEAIVLRFMEELRKRIGDEAMTSERIEASRKETENLVEIATAADQGFPHRGSVDFVNNTVDSTTGTIEIRATVENDPPVLFPGLFVRVRLPIQRLESAIVVEEKAIGTDLGGKYLYLVGDDNVVEQRYVELGPPQDDGTIVVREGIDGTESYIIDGILRARPGLPVTPAPAETAGAGG